LSAADICKIISECKGAGVAELCLGPLQLKFHPQGKEGALMPGKAGDESAEPLVSGPISENADLMNMEAFEDAAEAQLLIDDPLAYERSQIHKDIERGRVLNEKT